MSFAIRHLPVRARQSAGGHAGSDLRTTRNSSIDWPTGSVNRRSRTKRTSAAGCPRSALSSPATRSEWPTAVGDHHHGHRVVAAHRLQDTPWTTCASVKCSERGKRRPNHAAEPRCRRLLGGAGIGHHLALLDGAGAGMVIGCPARPDAPPAQQVAADRIQTREGFHQPTMASAGNASARGATPPKPNNPGGAVHRGQAASVTGRPRHPLTRAAAPRRSRP